MNNSGCLVFVLVLAHVPLSLQLFKLANQRSSYLIVTANHRLRNRVIKTQFANSEISCVHSCLREIQCKSINYLSSRYHCELNDFAPVDIDIGDKSALVSEKEWIFTAWVDITMKKFTFTSLGSRGPEGPTNIDGYAGTSLEGSVQLDKGIQLWTTPFSGNYVIEVFGASGAEGSCSAGCSTLGGKGARIKGKFSLKEGTKLRILIGQQGEKATNSPGPGGGGGGTFVALATENAPLIVAAGGGGGGNLDGDPGQVTRNGSRYGGHNGKGGPGCFNEKTNTWTTSSFPPYSTGAGFDGDGKAVQASTSKSFIKGGKGGIPQIGSTNGGFGGGGCALVNNPGGGGGFSGGGVVMLLSGSSVAGGGGSYNSGTDQHNIAGDNLGHGRVVVTFVL